MVNRLPIPKGVVFGTSEEKVRLESRNGAIQADFVLDTANNWVKGTPIMPALLLDLQRLAVNQIYRCAGHFRDGPVIISGGRHTPPDHTEVEGLVTQMCDYVNSHKNCSAVHLSAYVMWRLNWIHPFFGGNGRTARAFSYLVLCIGLGFAIPGSKTIPEFIVDDRDPYYEALRKADASAKQDGSFDISRMEVLISSLLAKQLKSVYDLATGDRAKSF